MSGRCGWCLRPSVPGDIFCAEHAQVVSNARARQVVDDPDGCQGHPAVCDCSFHENLRRANEVNRSPTTDAERKLSELALFRDTLKPGSRLERQLTNILEGKHYDAHPAPLAGPEGEA